MFTNRAQVSSLIQEGTSACPFAAFESDQSVRHILKEKWQTPLFCDGVYAKFGEVRQ